jgi:hypothetical protein
VYAGCPVHERMVSHEGVVSCHFSKVQGLGNAQVRQLSYATSIVSNVEDKSEPWDDRPSLNEGNG